MKDKSKIIIISVLLLGMSILNIAKNDVVFSSFENRYLQTFPEFSRKRLLNGTFSKEMESYASDQFFGRDSWVSLNTLINLSIGKQDNGRIFFGTEGWLFSLDANLEERNINSLTNFINLNEDKYPIDIVLVPTKSQVMSQFLPPNAPLANEDQMVNDLKSKIFNVIDLKPVLVEHEDEPIYYRTDHHWTSLGAYYAYQNLLKEDAHPFESFTIDTVSNNFYGTDFRKANASFIGPDEISVLKSDTMEDVSITLNLEKNVDSLFDSSFLNKTDQYGYFLGGDHALMSIKGSNHNGKNLMIIKDSFANSLIPFLVPHYETITVLDLRYYRGSVQEFIDESNISEISIIYNVQSLLHDKNLNLK